MTVDEALARLDGSDGKEHGAEASADGLGEIAEVLAGEVKRLRALVGDLEAEIDRRDQTAFERSEFD